MEDAKTSSVLLRNPMSIVVMTSLRASVAIEALQLDQR
jgi:hypothetical protein